MDLPDRLIAPTWLIAHDMFTFFILIHIFEICLSFPGARSSHPTKKHMVANRTPTVNDNVANNSMLTKHVKKKKGRNISSETSQKVKPVISCPESDGCARASINGWEWRNWARNATPSERARVRGYHVRTILSASNDNVWKNSQAKVSSARTNRVKLRNLLAAAEGSELLKITQMKVKQNYIF